VDNALLRALTDVVGAPNVLLDDDSRAPYEVDWSGRFAGRTAAVVRPGSVDEVAEIVAICRRNGVAIVPQGGNTGLVGGGVPLAGELVVSLRRLDAIGPVDVAARQVTAGAGATIEAVQQAASGVGLRYPVDWGARGTATVGGSIATNAGGMTVMRFGATRERVVGIEAVLGNGELVRRLGGLVKDNTGYHLPSLLCGSEGTLGIVTAARLSLVGATSHRVTALIGMTSVDAAVAAVASWRTTIASLEAAELMLSDGVALVADAYALTVPFESPAYVLLEAAGNDDPTDDLAEAAVGVEGVVDVAVADDASRRAALWRLREDHTLAINTVGVPHKFDVTVPVARLAEFVETVPHVVTACEPAARTWLFGHVGDGNVHVNVTGVGDRTALALDDTVFELVVSMGGCISAEHGIGTAKVRYLARDRSAAELAAMRAIKHALDPGGIMNPNVMLSGA
jgi:FAD/FMN-containing dehydrogenase